MLFLYIMLFFLLKLFDFFLPLSFAPWQCCRWSNGDFHRKKYPPHAIDRKPSSKVNTMNNTRRRWEMCRGKNDIQSEVDAPHTNWKGAHGAGGGATKIDAICFFSSSKGKKVSWDWDMGLACMWDNGESWLSELDVREMSLFRTFLCFYGTQWP